MGVVAQVFNLNALEAEAGRSELQPGLVYTVSSKIARAPWDPASETAKASKQNPNNSS